MATAINAPNVSTGSNPHDLTIGPAKSNNGKGTVGHKTTLNRAAAARMLEEESIFTFKPKVSPQSVKIAESLGSDFMSRQQQHIERQKKYMKPTMERATAAIDNKHGASETSASSKKQAADAEETPDSRSADAVKAWATPNTTTSTTPVDEAPPPTTSQSSPALASATSRTANAVKAAKPKSSTSVTTTTEERRTCKSAHVTVSTTKRRSRGRAKSAHLARRRAHKKYDGVDDVDQLGPSRSKTMPPGAGMGKPKLERKATTMGPNTDRVKNAKLTAERAMKNRKIFTIQGPYPAIREGLRRRGWVEKFYKLHMAPPPKKSPRNKRRKHAPAEQNDDDDDDDADDDDDDDDDNTDDDDDDDQGPGKVPPWEEDNGVYGIMSRIIRNVTPTFIWSVRRDVIDPKQLRRDQVINHYGKATFTTKVGLCLNIRNVPWYESTDPDTFFPRCYRLSHEEEKQAFTDDFRMTACINILKYCNERSHEMPDAIEEEDDEDKENKKSCTNPECTKSVPGQSGPNKCVHEVDKNKLSPSGKGGQEVKPIQSQSPRVQPKVLVLPAIPQQTSLVAQKSTGITGVILTVQEMNQSDSDEADPNGKKKKGALVSMKAVDFALKRLEAYIHFRSHDDIDQMEERDQPTDADWDQLIQWYYALVNDEGVIPGVQRRQKEITSVLEQMKTYWPQIDMDGYKNVWIVKPGAKSRGRGITCYANLEEMLKLVSASVMKDGKFVVQKYIERPLLIYNTKFDIRQWFLVTDWNPLTIWFYKDSYLRFCSQQYTLDDFDQSIHLSNNAIQKYCVNQVNRSSKLPSENMWDSDEFKQYLASRGHETIWDDLIYPGMKKAVLCALLCTQDIVEYRKSAFELYGADFMLTTDFHPWLIEINSSPSMSYGTKITERMCADVLDDSIKVVLDRKLDKNCDIGRFELAYKQPTVSVPPYIGLNLSLDGTGIKRPGNPTRRSEPAPLDPNRNSNTNYATRKSVPADNSDSKLTYGGGDKNDRSRVLAHIAREVPRVGLYTSGNKGGNHGGPAAGGGTKNSSSKKNHSSTSTVTDKGGGWAANPPSEDSETYASDASPSTPSSSTPTTSAPRVAGATASHSSSSAPKPHPNPTKSSSAPKTSAGGLHVQAVAATPLTFSLNSMTSVLQASLQKLESDSLPVMNSSLRRPSEPRKLLGAHLLNNIQEVDKDRLLTERIQLSATNSKPVPQPPEAATSNEALARGRDPSTTTTTISLVPGAWASVCGSCGKSLHARIESDPTHVGVCRCPQTDSVRTVGTWPACANITTVNNSSFPLGPPLPPTIARAKSPRLRAYRPSSGSQSSGHSFGKQAAPSGAFHLEKPKPPVHTGGPHSSTMNARNMQELHRRAMAASEGGRLPLRYTDGGIKKPELPSHKLGVSNAFPKLVSRYVGRKTPRDTMPVCIESYKQDSKLTIVNQSFL